MKVTDPEVRDRERTGGSRTGIVVGVILAILGLIAIARPVYATIASTLVFGGCSFLLGLLKYSMLLGRGEQVR